MVDVSSLRAVTAAALAGDAGTWTTVLGHVAAAHGLAPAPADDALAAWAEPGAAAHLGAVHESLLADRDASGTFYTPSALVAWVLDRALDPVLSDWSQGAPVPDVLDPSCGSGAFVLAVVRRVVERLGVAPEDVVPHVHGVDLDPVGVAITRLLLRIEAPGWTGEPDVVVGDGLEQAGRRFDVVVGNPPFLGRLKTRTATGRRGPAPYTDTSAVFLQHALDLVRPGGRVALVQPLSLLAARDAGLVRAAVAQRGAVESFWSSAEPVFTGASVLTCVPVVHVGEPQVRPVETWCGPTFTPGPAVPLPAGEWGPLAASSLGVPSVVLAESDGVLGDQATCTADFRDQYYGLVPYVRDGGTGAPLVTSGLVEPAASLWGRRPTRFARTSYDAPTVDLDALRAGDPRLGAWADARLVPKVLVATQGRVVEAVVDEDGAWLPSVPVVTVVPPPDRLWHVLAVLLAPPVTAHAAARYLGTALSAGAIKLSARQVAALPLPGDHDAWDAAAAHARAAQVGPDDQRPAALTACARAMCAAYGDRTALAWWLDRARIAGNIA